VVGHLVDRRRAVFCHCRAGRRGNARMAKDLGWREQRHVVNGNDLIDRNRRLLARLVERSTAPRGIGVDKSLQAILLIDRGEI
jgi:hypothetical protein